MTTSDGFTVGSRVIRQFPDPESPARYGQVIAVNDEEITVAWDDGRFNQVLPMEQRRYVLRSS